MRLLVLLFAALLAAWSPARAGEDGASEGKALESGEAKTLEYRGSSSADSYREHAPLALFSLGSLAVGGIFYGIHSSLDYPGGQSSGDGSKVGMAVGAAGFTALAAGVSYFYYSWRGRKAQEHGLQKVSAGVAPDGSLSATVTFPLSALAD